MVSGVLFGQTMVSSMPITAGEKRTCSGILNELSDAHRQITDFIPRATHAISDFGYTAVQNAEDISDQTIQDAKTLSQLLSDSTFKHDTAEFIKRMEQSALTMKLASRRLEIQLKQMTCSSFWTHLNGNKKATPETFASMLYEQLRHDVLEMSKPTVAALRIATYGEKFREKPELVREAINFLEWMDTLDAIDEAIISTGADGTEAPASTHTKDHLAFPDHAFDNAANFQQLFPTGLLPPPKASS